MPNLDVSTFIFCNILELSLQSLTNQSWVMMWNSLTIFKFRLQRKSLRKYYENSQMWNLIRLICVFYMLSRTKSKLTSFSQEKCWNLKYQWSNFFTQMSKLRNKFWHEVTWKVGSFSWVVSTRYLHKYVTKGLTNSVHLDIWIISFKWKFLPCFVMSETITHNVLKIISTVFDDEFPRKRKTFFNKQQLETKISYFWDDVSDVSNRFVLNSCWI